ncbi:MAG: CHAT domain-containing protein [Caldilineaceae bacterium]
MSEIATQRAELAKLDYSAQALDTTVANVLAKLNSVWAAVSPADQDAIQSRRRALAVALTAGGISGGEAERLLVEFLRGLETIDSVVRLAYAELRAGKQTQTFRSGGGRGASPAVLDAISTAPDTGGDPRLDTSATVPYFTKVDFPPTIASRDDSVHPLVIRLVVNRPAQSQADVQLNIEFLDPAVPELVEVHLTAPGFEETTRINRRTLIVYKGEDSDPAIFLLKLLDKTAGDKELRLDFYHLGYPIGSATFKTEVSLFNTGGAGATRTPAGRPAIRTGPRPLLGGRTGIPAPPQAEPDSSAGTATLVEGIDGLRFAKPGTVAPDVILRVVQGEDGKTLHFKLLSPQGKIGYREKEMGKVIIQRLKDPTLLLADYFAELNTMAQSSIAAIEPAQAEDFLARTISFGNAIYEQMFPEELKEEYWRIKKLRDEGKIQTLLVLSDEPWIPWEMAYPYHDDQKENDFLAGSWQMSRWQAGLGLNPELTVKSVQLVTPTLDLAFVQGEKAYFEQIPAAQPAVTIGEPITDRSSFLAQIKKGNVQLLHFATHASFVGENADSSPIHLEAGETITPVDLSGPATVGLRRERPIVFLNACHGGRLEFTLTGLGGWAERMVKQAAATAFVGAYWEINDELASLFACTFYDGLRRGAPLAEAFHAARQALRVAAPANPTWLAYTLYGDPNAHIYWGEEK